MDQTPNLKLPYILPSQAQKHVNHNEALRFLDAMVHLSVRSRSRADAPAPLTAETVIWPPRPLWETGPAKTG